MKHYGALKDMLKSALKQAKVASTTLDMFDINHHNTSISYSGACILLYISLSHLMKNADNNNT